MLISLKKTFQKLEWQMPENQFFETQPFSSRKGAHTICFGERHVPATRVSSESVLGGFTSAHMGGRAVQMSRKGTRLMAGSCSCWSQNYTFLSFCQKQSVILVTLYFPHCIFPCNYWIQLDSPCCIINYSAICVSERYEKKWSCKSTVKSLHPKNETGLSLYLTMCPNQKK